MEASKKLHGKRNAEVFQHIRSAKNKMLKAHLNLVARCKTICHGTEKMLILILSCAIVTRQSTVQTTVQFLTKK